MIHVRGLARRFQTRRATVDAVRGVDLDVAAGEIVGFLGPNGAGKTTTLRMLTTLLEPSAGSAEVAGHDLRREPAAVRRRIGYVAQGGGCSPQGRVREELVLQARLHRLDRDRARRRVDELMDRFALGDLADRTTATLSGGQRRRLDLAIGLVHDPAVLFLDEPTAALDPQSRAHVWDHVRALNADHHATVFLTTHYLDEADALCDRVLVIDHGRIVAAGTPAELKRQVSGDVVEVAGPRLAALAEIAGRLRGARDVATTADSVRFRVPRGDTALPELMRALDQASVPLTSVQVHHPTLDDVFLAVTGRSLRDDAPEATRAA
ncbi:ATP-binding cassette domain-containing protein [Streptoalloteichus hindustanus]|uniref:ABC-2 type transport system ATP-binding protein n=1 Tax=Streptoalloteichus hindustanus TaxID=2017 RepID=A0A1M5KWK3_STRHI|nr:ATP-binding cassette domain-containing protein [Streptoalloteichus hindustanus]SHG57116.1 ABC-2 type transport system ATP-binding protein [Streptoalloteichus hindustanus]